MYKASNMIVAINRLNILRIGCFAHTLNLGAQKIYTSTALMIWVRRIRNTVVWFMQVPLGKVVLREKQDLQGIKEHSLVLDGKTRCNTMFLMMERFIEQHPALQVAARDPRLKKSVTKDKLEHICDDDLYKCEEFGEAMKILYTSTLAVSSDKLATSSQIIPI